MRKSITSRWGDMMIMMLLSLKFRKQLNGTGFFSGICEPAAYGMSPFTARGAVVVNSATWLMEVQERRGEYGIY